MPDFSLMSDLYTDEELGTESDQEQITTIENRLKDLHTCLPGIIKSYDPTTNTAQVQPAVQRVFVESGPVNLPLIVDVPVVFPGGGSWAVTFPVAAGDECVLVFSERCIDYWHVTGQIKPPATYRFHDISDAFAFVGVRSQARKLSNIQTDGVELRNSDRSVALKLNATGVVIQGNVTVQGTLTAADFATGTGPTAIKLSTHLHPSGTPNTGAPIPPP